MLLNQTFFNRCSCPIGLSRLVVLVLLFSGLFRYVNADEYEYEDYAMVNITAGQVGIMDNLDGPQRYGVEFRFSSFAGPGGFRLNSAVGIAIAKNGANFIHTDLRHDFYLSPQWLLVPSLGVGQFNESSEIDLGSDLQFRSGIELARKFENKIRAGLALFHLSNGGISDQNPGTEVLVFHICFPVMTNQ